MPGRSPNEVVVSDAERAELEHVAACYTRPHLEVQRAKLVLMAAEGLTNTEIGARLGMSREAVGRWRRRFCEQRLDGLRDKAAGWSPAPFSPGRGGQVKAIACELPKDQGVPFSRFSRSELHRFVVERGVLDESASTIGRRLAEDAIKPWQCRSWIFPRDPDFLERAGRVLDLYQGR
jgi:transposase